MARAWSWSGRRFETCSGQLKRERRQVGAGAGSRVSKTLSVNLCGPPCLGGEDSAKNIYHRATETDRDYTEKNFDEIDALLIPPLRFSFLHEGVHTFARVFSLHLFV